VDDVVVSAAKPLAAVRAEIAAQIQERKALNAVNDLAGRIETAISEGSSFDEVVAANKLAAKETAPVTATGTAPDTPGWQAPPELQPLLEGAFALEPGEDPGVETVEENKRYALVAITRTVPSAAPPLAAVRDRVKADLIVRRASERARAVASAIVARINGGMPPAPGLRPGAGEASAGANAHRHPARDRAPGRSGPAAAGDDVQPSARQGPNPRSPDGRGWFVVYLDKIVPGDARSEPGLIQAVRSQFGSILGDEYARQFTTAIRGALKIERNEDALRKLRSDLLGPGATQ
jgi:peptidyl-prolyl cis-trans isomerase D